jgi:hypothetical protein
VVGLTLFEKLFKLVHLENSLEIEEFPIVVSVSDLGNKVFIFD